VSKRSRKKVKVTCQVRVASSARRLPYRVTRRGRTVTRGFVAVRRGRAIVRLGKHAGLRKGSYKLRVARSLVTTIRI
jgi:hypothetical protein